MFGVKFCPTNTLTIMRGGFDFAEIIAELKELF
jgi:hypothetical protein